MPLYLVILCIVAVLIFVLAIKLTFSLINFKEELRYINMEIHRTDGEDRKYWKKKRRRLWLSLFI
ncbi:MAG: hypothetical protein IJ462_01450 [Clostridia bacterium]|nr:hypothetical protein [Clostridia bacterium]